MEKIVIFSGDKPKLEISDIINGFKYSFDLLNGSPKMHNSAETTLKEKLFKFEKECILHALMTSNWEIGSAADLLGIDRTNLFRKMKKFGIKKA
ncbi:MAG: hypothetical protein Kow00108_24120 [Calditrichia bacterium]